MITGGTDGRFMRTLAATLEVCGLRAQDHGMAKEDDSPEAEVK
jgi:hypothetical protein